jgi:hypothetical protein
MREPIRELVSAQWDARFEPPVRRAHAYPICPVGARPPDRRCAIGRHRRDRRAGGRQEPALKASPKRIYDALTDAQQFQKLTMLSVDARGTDFATKPVIRRELGSAFSLFAGYATGRQIEPVPSQRLVQAWRAGGWPIGVFSIARFELVAEGASRKIVFDRTGFLQGDAEHLAAGWKSHYRQGLEKFPAQLGAA